MRHLAAILHHRPDPSDGPPHFDLLVGRAGRTPEELDLRDARTWRCDRRADQLESGQSGRIEAIAPHRRWWLTRPVGEVVVLREPLGEASMIETGAVQVLEEHPDGLKLRILWSQCRDVMIYSISDGLLRCEPQPPRQPASVRP